MEVVEEQIPQGALEELYVRVKSKVWVLEFGGEMKKIFTGFAISKYGYILTCAHGWSDKSNVKMIMGRTLDEVGFNHKLEVVALERKWDVALLKVENGDNDDFPFVDLASNGSLVVGEAIIHIGNPKEFVASCMIGSVAYPCVDDVELPDSFRKCQNFICNSLKETPRYRILGHVWNSDFFEQMKKGQFLFERGLHPSIPIIQCAGLTFKEGSDGGPMFNRLGEVVGLMSLEAHGFRIGIHVTVLRALLKKSLTSDALKEVFGAGEAPAGEASKKRRL